ncbi:MAG: hypothetical protein K2N11_05480 [Mucispirillum sp.]|nr:hypothetical protein [Mucispirillum sp.]
MSLRGSETSEESELWILPVFTIFLLLQKVEVCVFIDSSLRSEWTIGAVSVFRIYNGVVTG